MASTSLLLLHSASRAAAALRSHAVSLPPPPSHSPHSRRQCLHTLLVSAAAPFVAFGSSSAASAEDIPLFGLRKRIKKIEEEVGEIVEEGKKVVEEGFVAAEKGIEEAEKEIAAGGAGFRVGVAGDLLQAGAVAGAEAFGVLVGLSLVNGILATERQKT